MAQQKAIIDKLLTNVSSMYVPDGFICDMVLPTVPSKSKTGKLAKYGTDHLRIENTIIGGDGKYRVAKTITRTDTSYSIEGHGLAGQVSEDDYNEVEQPYAAEEDEALGLTTTIALGKEKGLADTLADTSVMTSNTTLSGSDQWSDFANSDPIGDADTARATIKGACGHVPNLLVLSWEVYNKVRFHPGILDSLGFKDNRPGGLSRQELAVAFDIQKILIGMASYESATKGQTSVLAPVWGKHAIFMVSPPAARKKQTSVGYQFKLSGRASRRVFKYAINNPPNSTGILVDDHYDMAITNVSAGYLIHSAIA